METEPFALGGCLYLQVSGLGQTPDFFHPKQMSSVCLPLPLPIKPCAAEDQVPYFLSSSWSSARGHAS